MKSLLALVMFAAWANAMFDVKQYGTSKNPVVLAKAQLPSNVSRSAGGAEGVEHALPYQVALYPIFYDFMYFCSGTLISTKFVLTAAQCLDGISGVVVLLGAHNIDIMEESHEYIYSRNFRKHELYDRATMQNDIGLIELNPAVTFNKDIQPVKLPRYSDEEKLLAYETATLSGWGIATENEYSLRPVLRTVNLTVMTYFDCYFRYYLLKESEIVHDSNICTSGWGGVGAGAGDTGGPLVINGTQVGIVSFGLPYYCQSGFPTGYTRLDSYLKWIEKHTGIRIPS